MISDKLETAPSFLMAPLSFATCDFSRERIEMRQPECPEPIEPVVDLAQPPQLHGIDTAGAVGGIEWLSRRRGEVQSETYQSEVPADADRARPVTIPEVTFDDL
ncbi:hypothetical protein [Bradyrhizobium sp. USDA 4452]